MGGKEKGEEEFRSCMKKEGRGFWIDQDPKWAISPLSFPD